MKVPKLSQHKRRAYATNIVAHNHQSRELLSSKISRFLEEFHVGRILQACNAYKVRGFSVKDVFQVAFENAFSSKSFFQKQRESSTSIPFAKDTFYRFMNSSSINWRKFTLQLSSAVIQKIEPLTNEKRRNVLIIDDSLFSRARAKKVELLAKVYDHVEHKYTKGFRMLTLGWSDGNSFLPLSQCLLSSAERENRLQEASSDIDARSNGGKLRKLAQTKATSVMLTLLKEAKDADIPAKYVLFDTWFCSPDAMLQIKNIGYDVVGMVKKGDKRSIGELFYVSCDELQDLQYMDALIMVLKKLVSMITEKWLFLEKELNAMLDSFLENLPDLWHNCLNRCA